MEPIADPTNTYLSIDRHGLDKKARQLNNFLLVDLDSDKLIGIDQRLLDFVLCNLMLFRPQLMSRSRPNGLRLMCLILAMLTYSWQISAES